MCTGQQVLVRIPGWDEVFPSVDYRDTMHALKIFLHRVIVLETLCYIHLDTAQKRLMLNRLSRIGERHGFRDRHGTSYRNKIQIFKEANMSAKDKVALLFLLPHVFGHKAEILPQSMRGPMLTALAYAQLLIIASSGQRRYNTHELKTIFDRGYIQLFGALQAIRTLEKHRRLANGDACSRFRPQTRYVLARVLAF